LPLAFDKPLQVSIEERSCGSPYDETVARLAPQGCCPAIPPA
jgi:hypothetical protein